MSANDSAGSGFRQLENIRVLLIANRGEIAARVMRTARHLEVRTVAIYAPDDRHSPHVRLADEAFEVSSYLDIDEVVAAAARAGADAVHPGYGFLSERPEFAHALEATGIRLVGPSAEVMTQMGRKDAAREIALAAGVPVVPQGEPDDAEGFPVLVKAAAGGGGKGMRIVREPRQLEEATAAAKREAASAFGDDTMLIEKYVERGRHIEVQIMADVHGTVLHLGERDCSAQRRHQKVLEEAPAPDLTQAQRDGLQQAAVGLAAHVGYTGAGTVEFLLDIDSGEYYFLEMNTRLQVEHPVTESVTRLDLVGLQLLVADGQPLALTQDDVHIAGHAIEARIYAEDAFGGFLPQAGHVSAIAWPEAYDIRIDSGVEPGSDITTSYDPMLAKLIVFGSDRETARRRLIDALDHTAITGVTTNVGFLRALASTAEFTGAEIDTAWLDREQVEPPSDETARTLAALHRARRSAADSASIDGALAGDGFRIAGPAADFRADLDTPVQVAPAQIASTTVEHTASGLDLVSAQIDGTIVRGFASADRHSSEVVWHGQRFVFTAPDVAHEDLPVGDGQLVAPMPGTVLDVRVAEDEEVVQDQVLAVLEAMKMELSIRAPFAGTVVKVDAATGDQVALGAPLVRVEASET